MSDEESEKSVSTSDIAEATRAIDEGRTSLGIEFGSTRIKAVLIDEEFETLAEPSERITYDENRYTDEIIVEREGRSGSKWHTYLQYLDAEGNLIKEEPAYDSVYRAIAKKLIVGTRPRDGQPLWTVNEDGQIVYNGPIDEPED